MELLDNVIEQTKGLIDSFGQLVGALGDLRNQLEADGAAANVTPIAAAPPPVDAEQVRVAEEGHVDELPFKCPGCGATYEKQVECANGHQPIETLPTEDVLAGAPAPDTTKPDDVAPANQSAGETATITGAPAEEPAASADPPPDWPTA